MKLLLLIFLLLPFAVSANCVTGNGTGNITSVCTNTDGTTTTTYNDGTSNTVPSNGCVTGADGIPVCNGTGTGTTSGTGTGTGTTAGTGTNDGAAGAAGADGTGSTTNINIIPDFLTPLFTAFTNFCNWLIALISSVFSSFFILLKDFLIWSFDEFMKLVVYLLSQISLSSVTGLIPAFVIPPEVLNILGLIGFGNCLAIILAAITIRIILQLIPFTRLGS